VRRYSGGRKKQEKKKKEIRRRKGATKRRRACSAPAMNLAASATKCASRQKTAATDQPSSIRYCARDLNAVPWLYSSICPGQSNTR